MFPTATEDKVPRFQFKMAILDSFLCDSLWDSFTGPSGVVCVFFPFRLVSFDSVGLGESARGNSANG